MPSIEQLKAILENLDAYKEWWIGRILLSSNPNMHP
jgi:hypothetical protein